MRSIVYSTDVTRFETDKAEFKGTTAGDRGSLNESQFTDKLVKYIPAEVLAVFLPLYMLAQSTNKVGWVWAVMAGGLIGAVGYSHIRSESELAAPRPVFSYVLTAVAFICWTIGTSTAGQDLVGISPQESQLIMALAVFLLPLADTLIQAAPSKVTSAMWLDPSSRKIAKG